MDWLGVKHAIIATTDVSADALHLLGGILIYLPLAVLLDQRLRSLRALALTALLVCAGEAGDWYAYRLNGEALPMIGIWPDLIGGLTWPVLLFVAGPWLQPCRPALPARDHG
jgi:hypothetical protein